MALARYGVLVTLKFPSVGNRRQHKECLLCLAPKIVSSDLGYAGEGQQVETRESRTNTALIDISTCGEKRYVPI